MEKMRCGLLIFEKPFNGRLVVHCLGDSFGCRFAVCLEQQFWIVFHVYNGWVKPYRNDNAKIVCFVLRNVSGSNCVEDTMGNGCLNRSHQYVCIK